MGDIFGISRLYCQRTIGTVLERARRGNPCFCLSVCIISTSSLNGSLRYNAAIHRASLDFRFGQQAATSLSSPAFRSAGSYRMLNQADLLCVYDNKLIMCLSRELPDCL